MSFNIVFDEGVLQEKIGEATVKIINSAVENAKNIIGARLGELMVEHIKENKTYESLVDGDLRGELGVVNAESAMAPILAIVKRSVNFNFIPFKYSRGKITGSFTINLLANGLKEILSQPTASYQSNEYIVPWLSFLLEKGDTIILIDYHVVTDLNSKQQASSRTGEALMFPGGGFRVNPIHSGTSNDNFITKSILNRDFQREANKIVNEEIQRSIK